MKSISRALKVVATAITITVAVFAFSNPRSVSTPNSKRAGAVTVHQPQARDTSRPLQELVMPDDADVGKTAEIVQQNPPPAAPIVPPVITSPPGAAAVEQKSQGTRASAELVESFDGLGAGFEGPHGTATLRNPSDNSLAVGPNHIFQIVNTRMAIFTKKGRQFPASGKVLYGPVPTNTVFKGFGGACEAMNNGDAVVRYDQLADRWLVVMPTFRRGPVRPDQPKPGRSGDPAHVSVPGQAGQPGPPVPLFSPPPQLGQPPQPRGQTSQRAHRDRTRCAMQSAPDRIHSGLITATSSCGRSSPTIRGRQSGPMVTTHRPAPATK